MLYSRRIPREQFVQEFLRTLQPGLIPRQDFIKWDAVQHVLESSKDALGYFATLQDIPKAQLLEQVRDGLLSADDPYAILKAAFGILGHTPDVYVSDQDQISIKKATRLIAEGDTRTAEQCARIIIEIGFPRILARSEVADVFLGVRIGLECNRRKNVGGGLFADAVGIRLHAVASKIKKDYAGIRLEKELRIGYGDALSKRVDYALLQGSRPVIGFEINFYTTTGSKPTEIKRSYGNVTKGLASAGVELVWVTDGAGYNKMKRSLGDAFTILPNVYNLHMVEEYLEDDLRKHLG